MTSARNGGFTLVELLVVIVILAILIAMTAATWSYVSNSQKVNLTRMIMGQLSTALDEFAEMDPLSVGANKNDRLRYPPIQLRDPYPPINCCGGDPIREHSVVGSYEPCPPSKVNGPCDNRLAVRLAWSLLGNGDLGDDRSMVNIADGAFAQKDHDSRSLYTYLRFFNPSGLDRVPARFQHALETRQDVGPEGEFIRKNPMHAERVNIFAVHDAWDVPIDYMMYVRLEYYVKSNGIPGFRVADRMPVLRSRGISKDALASQGATQTTDPRKWILSSPLPSPQADVQWDNRGVFNVIELKAGGWARVVGIGEQYGYTVDMGRDH